MTLASKYWLVCLALLVSSASAKDREVVTSPQAAGRTYGQNYKDMVLTLCISKAYAKDAGVAKDAGSSFNALRDWTYYDLENAPQAMNDLVDAYLARDYSNPIVESEVKGIRFDMLKCLDLFHSRELDQQVKRIVMHPKRTYRGDAKAGR